MKISLTVSWTRGWISCSTILLTVKITSTVTASLIRWYRSPSGAVVAVMASSTTARALRLRAGPSHIIMASVRADFDAQWSAEILLYFVSIACLAWAMSSANGAVCSPTAEHTRCSMAVMSNVAWSLTSRSRNVSYLAPIARCCRSSSARCTVMA
jgi:hypothetical protein